MRKSPDASHFEEHDEDTESEIDVPCAFRREDGRGDTPLAEGDYDTVSNNPEVREAYMGVGHA